MSLGVIAQHWFDPLIFPGATGSAKNPSATTTTLTLSAAPPVGSIVLLAIHQSFSVVFTVSGLGATWTRLHRDGSTGITEIWVGVGCNGSDTQVTSSAGSTTTILSAAAFTGITDASPQSTGDGSNAVAVVGPLTAPAKGGLAFAVSAVGSGSVSSELPSAWTALAVGGDSNTQVGYIILTPGQVASRTMNGNGRNTMVLLEAVV